jgi:hypothetical protein
MSSIKSLCEDPYRKVYVIENNNEYVINKFNYNGTNYYYYIVNNVIKSLKSDKNGDNLVFIRDESVDTFMGSMPDTPRKITYSYDLWSIVTPFQKSL